MVERMLCRELLGNGAKSLKNDRKQEIQIFESGYFLPNLPCKVGVFCLLSLGNHHV
jgi:hypothetical protein